MTMHQFWGLLAIIAGLVTLVGIGRALYLSRGSEEDEWDDWDGGYDGELGPETVRLSQDPGTGEFARIPDEIPDEWDDESLAMLHEDSSPGNEEEFGGSFRPSLPFQPFPGLGQDPPTDERLERVVLALTESPEAWRARVEQESYEWRARMQGYFTDPIDFGQPLELAA